MTGKKRGKTWAVRQWILIYKGKRKRETKKKTFELDTGRTGVRIRDDEGKSSKRV